MIYLNLLKQTTKKKEKLIPAASIRGTYSTYENMKQRSLNQRLGNVVDLRLENMAMIEIGGWGTTLRILPFEGYCATINEAGNVVIKAKWKSKSTQEVGKTIHSW